MNAPTLRTVAASLAIVAMLLRAILPDGWMPQAAHDGVSLVICTMNGPLRVVLDNDGQPTKQDPGRSHHADLCPFATAAHWAAPTAQVSLTPASFFGMSVDRAAKLEAIEALSPYAPQSPRAPPSLV